MNDMTERIANLGCWSRPVQPQRLAGGLTNVNYLVEDAGEKYVVRTGEDIRAHRIMRFNELSAARAAERIGISPSVVHHEPGVLVMRYIEGRTLTEADIRQSGTLVRVLELIKLCHRRMATEVRGPVLAFWPFHVVYDYAHTLREGHSRMLPALADFLRQSAELERAVGHGETRFCHNDLLAANFLDTGARMWLIDWDYAGFNNPLFDLAGLASNNQFTEDDERTLLNVYFDDDVSPALYYRFKAMKAVSLLRESMWSMVSEIHSGLAVDYERYTEENLERFARAWDEFTRAGPV